jgi:hypothetical protein
MRKTYLGQLDAKRIAAMRRLSRAPEELERPSLKGSPVGYEIYRNEYLIGEISVTDDPVRVFCQVWGYKIEGLTAKPFYYAYNRAAEEDSRRAEEMYAMESDDFGERMNHES